MISHYDPTVKRNVAYLLTPFMIENLLNLVSFVRVNIEDALKEVFKTVTDKVRKNVLTWKYLFIKLRGVAVLKWKVSTNHCKQYDSTWPDINLQSIVFFTGNHLRGSIARWPTSRLEHLSRFIRITQTKIYYFETILPVNQQVLGLKITMNYVKLV